MEELRTTEALGREILEDARKKACKILKTADDTLAVQKREWEEKANGAVDSIRKVYSERLKKTTEEIFARLPLDKRRLRSENAEKYLVKAMDDFLRSLKRETLLSVLKDELSERLAAETGNDDIRGAEVRYSGMSLSEAGALLEEITNGRLHAPGFFEAAQTSEFPFIEINTKAIKITASVENAAAVLLKDKRAELAAALLGEGVLND